MILGKLIAIFVLIPIFELYILLEIGRKIGIFSTIAIVIITGIVGAYLVKQQGFYVLFKMKSQMNEGIIPAESLLEGVLILIGGIFLITPGIITDIGGFLLIIPQSRFVIFRYAKQWLLKKISKHSIHYTSNRYE